jgi:hypothetical protein
MKPINHLDLIAKNLLDGRIKRLGHIQDNNLDLVEFFLWAAFEPLHHVFNPPAFERGDRPTFV